MNQHEAQSKYKEFKDKLNAPYCVGVAQHLERLALKKELEQFRQSCSANGITLLEPCPFCGSYEIETLNEIYDRCECQICGAEGPTDEDATKAIAAWNKRVG